jgi:hypothetical protein
MKDLKISIAIIIASIIISSAIIISSKNDQLSNCVNRLMKSEETGNVVEATLICNRRIN